MTPEVLADEPQADGNRHVRFRFTHSSGHWVDRRYNVPEGIDAIEYANGRAPRIEKQEKRSELERSLAAVESGTPPKDVPLLMNTRNGLFRFLLKRLANADPETALAYAQHFSQFTDAQVATLLNEPEAKVAAWRAKLLALKAAKDDYGHSFPEYEV